MHTQIKSNGETNGMTKKANEYIRARTRSRSFFAPVAYTLITLAKAQATTKSGIEKIQYDQAVLHTTMTTMAAT